MRVAVSLETAGTLFWQPVLYDQRVYREKIHSVNVSVL